MRAVLILNYIGMKILTTPIYIFAFFAILFFPKSEVKAQNNYRVSFQTFYNELEPYGRWINNPELGFIWVPDEGRDFQPYMTNGRWIMTEFGNTWLSDYPWGWAPFHYGRWGYDDYYGWFWVPGDEWGPAWVTWRSGGDYYGWAPIPPGVSINISINIPFTRWFFVPKRYVSHHRVYDYCVPSYRVRNIYPNTYVINNYYERNNRRYFYGPRIQDIERATRSRVVVRHLDNSSRPGRAELVNNNVRIYKPNIYRDDRQDRPSRVETNSRPRPNRESTQVENRIPGRTERTENNERKPEVRRSEENARPVRSEPARDANQGNRERTSRENADRPQPPTRSENPPQNQRPERPSRPDRSQSVQRTERPAASSNRNTQSGERSESSRSDRGNSRPQRN